MSVSNEAKLAAVELIEEIGRDLSNMTPLQLAEAAVLKGMEVEQMHAQRLVDELAEICNTAIKTVAIFPDVTLTKRQAN